MIFHFYKSLDSPRLVMIYCNELNLAKILISLQKIYWWSTEAVVIIATDKQYNS